MSGRKNLRANHCQQHEELVTLKVLTKEKDAEQERGLFDGLAN